MNAFRSLDFCSNQIQDLVIDVIVKAFKERKNTKVEIAFDLMCQLFECFHFDFWAFCQQYIKSHNQKKSFLSYLLSCIYYNEIPILNLANEKNREFLNEFLVTLLVECVPAKQVRFLIDACSNSQKLKLVCQCGLYPREGSWTIFQSFLLIYAKDPEWGSLLNLLKTKYYDVDYFKSMLLQGSFDIKLLTLKLKEKAEGQIHYILALKIQSYPYSFDQLREFFKIFGLHGYYIDLVQENSIDQILQMAMEMQRNPLLHGLPSFEIVRSFITQLFQELDTFHHHPLEYIEGLKRLVYALPTRGLNLPFQPWLPSILEGLSKLIEYLHQKGFSEIKLNEFPIIVFDQASAMQLKKNYRFIQKLSNHYKATILHISKKQILELAKKINLQSWIQTVPDQTSFGYAGSRNCVFFLAPLLFKAFLMGKKTFQAVMKMSRSELKNLFNVTTLGLTQQDMMIHLGEDDVNIPSSHLFLNASFTHRHQNLFVSRPVYCIGRATHVVNPLVDLKSILNKPCSAFFSSHWNPFPVSGRMKGMISKPRFCLPLPFGNEELHVIPTHYICEYFHQPIIHLGGTRFPSKNIPISPLDGLDCYLSNYLPYSIQICMLSSLTDPSNALHQSIFPWNDEALRTVHKFNCLGDLWNYASLSDTLSEMQERFWINLKKSYNDPGDLFNLSIQGLVNGSNLPRSVPPSLKKFYIKMKADASDLLKLWRDLIDLNRRVGSLKNCKGVLYNQMMLLTYCLLTMKKQFKKSIDKD